ncbi:hypothetical protein HK107_14680 [Parvularcula sp. ZS-1/3]|uniref:DUF2834 domain-containing protein n=1 Tax=Parvularcula mediterranea TaxID=2732508 RepID=A0A7Y3W6C2_9PROT|nr:hypothetical protein [Parvularcula mediterranea]NNU17574.1 hypothetical protein [Parvularcula mediterranea]
MDLTAIIPFAGLAAFLVIVFASVLGDGKPTAMSWILPTLILAIFTIFSVIVVVQDGPLGFWEEHVLGLWGNQIWLDLLIALGMTLILLAPRARAVGMRPVLYALLTCCTGSIGTLALFGRLRYLEYKSAG